MSESRNKIKVWSRRLRLVLGVVFWMIPLVTLAFWAFVDVLPPEAVRTALPYPAQQALPLSAKAMGFVVSLLPAGASMYGVRVLMRLFRLYEQGQIFTAANVRCFGNLAKALFLWFGASVLSTPLLSMALTLHYPPGQRSITLSLGSPDLTALFLGLALRVAAWVMAEAQELQEEQELTV